MAYSVNNEHHSHRDMQQAHEISNTIPWVRNGLQFEKSNMLNICRPYVCKDLYEFSLSYVYSGGSNIIDDQVTQRLFDEFCKTFHNDDHDIDDYIQQWFSYIISSNSLPVSPNIKEEFIRIVSAIQENKRSMIKVHDLIKLQRDTTNLTSPISTEQMELAKDLFSLDEIAKKIVTDWNTHWNRVLQICNYDANRAMSGQRYFRMNIQCRLVNYARERFPEVESKKRKLFLKYFREATSIFQLFPFVGCDFIIHPDFPSDRCIFKNTNSCCIMRDNVEPQISLRSEKTIQLLAEKFSFLGLADTIYYHCLQYNVYMKKPRMAYTKRFSP